MSPLRATSSTVPSCGSCQPASSSGMQAMSADCWRRPRGLSWRGSTGWSPRQRFRGRSAGRRLLSASYAWSRGDRSPSPRDLQQREGGRHPGHPVAGLHPHPGDLERAEAPPPLHTGPTRCTAVHRDRQNHQGRRDVAGLSLRTGLHILGVIPSPPQPVHPR